MSDTTKSVDDELMRIVWHALAEQMTHAISCKDAEHIEQRSCVDFTKKTFDKTIEAITQLFTKQRKKLDHIQDILNMQQKVMLEHYGRPDCKNCSLAETIQEVLDQDDGGDDE